ncbi:MAG: M48 family metallopeptidase [Desulfobulbaceae bacterium]|nr:M48 family metallopeptidase [Desulfobulbaceae bacterium]
MNGYLIFILAVILLSYLLEGIVSILNLRSLTPELPAEFSDVFDEKKYAKSQKYTRATTGFGFLQSSIMTMITIPFILLGGFNWIDIFSRSFEFGSIMTGLIFTGILVFLSGAVSLPFAIYSTFVIEERFGFNTTSIKTFILDIIKSTFLSILIGGPLLAFVLWFFATGGQLAWLYCWLVVVSFIIILQFLAPVIIMPLFNKFTPLEEGELQQSITDYARKQDFRMKGIYTMDGSKRSTKLNAFFTGFGRFRRIVFFDTLIDKLSVHEIVAVLAHEMGHFKKKHIFKMMAASIVQMGIMFYILSLFLNNERLFAAFGMENLSIYASLIFFGFLYSPISMLLGIVFNFFSRRNEYEADAYAVTSTGRPLELVKGLKKLSATNLSNLTPHPFHVFLNYSHPPVLERIRAIRNH